MSVQTTVTRLKNMWDNITGVTTAFENVPMTLNDVELPAVVMFPGEATYNKTQHGESVIEEERLYRMVLFVQRAAYGTETQGQTAVEPFFDRVRDYFVARPQLTLDGASEPQTVVYQSQLSGDGGYQIIPYSTGGEEQTDFAGIEFRLQVTEIASITYQG